MLQTLVKVGNSQMLSVPSKIIKKNNLSKATGFILEEREDGLFFKYASRREITFPKIRLPESLSEDMKFVLDNRVSFTEDDKKNPLIKALADESFH